MQKETVKNRKIMMLIALLAGIGLALVAVYEFFTNGADARTVVTGVIALICLIIGEVLDRGLKKAAGSGARN